MHSTLIHYQKNENPYDPQFHCLLKTVGVLREKLLIKMFCNDKDVGFEFKINYFQTVMLLEGFNTLQLKML